MNDRPGFPTYEAARRLEAACASGVEPVPLSGSPSPALPPHACDAVARVLAGPMAAPSSRGLAALRTAYAAELERSTGRHVDPRAELIVTNGAMHALGICMRSLLAPGDEVVIPAPTFFFEGPIRAAGAEPVFVVAAEGDGWRWDAERVERAIGPRTRALLLCNPGNPTGCVPSSDEVEAVVAVAVAHGLLVITDEAYEAALWGDARLSSAFGLAEDAIVIRSLGKSLAMPQLRLGIVSGPRHRVDPCAATLEWDCLRVDLVAQEAALSILTGPRDWLSAVHDGLAADRAVAIAAVGATPGLSARAPAAAPFLFVSAETGGEVSSTLLDAGLPVVDGAHFQAPGYARLPFGGAAAAREALSTALARWAEGQLG